MRTTALSGIVVERRARRAAAASRVPPMVAAAAPVTPMAAVVRRMGLRDFSRSLMGGLDALCRMHARGRTRYPAG